MWVSQPAGRVEVFLMGHENKIPLKWKLQWENHRKIQENHPFNGGFNGNIIYK